MRKKDSKKGPAIPIPVISSCLSNSSVTSNSSFALASSSYHSVASPPSSSSSFNSPLGRLPSSGSHHYSSTAPALNSRAGSPTSPPTHTGTYSYAWAPPSDNRDQTQQQKHPSKKSTSLGNISEVDIPISHHSTSKTQTHGEPSDSDDFSLFFDSPDFADVEVVAEEERFYAHAVILGKWSDVFRRMLLVEMKEKHTRQITLPGKKADNVEAFLRWFYLPQQRVVTEGKVDGFLVLAHEYGVRAIVDACETFLVNKVSKNDMPGCVRCLETAQRYNLPKLKSRCDEVLAAQPFSLLNSCFEQLTLAEHYGLPLLTEACILFAAEHSHSVLHPNVLNLSPALLQVYLNKVPLEIGAKLDICVAWARKPAPQFPSSLPNSPSPAPSPTNSPHRPFSSSASAVPAFSLPAVHSRTQSHNDDRTEHHHQLHKPSNLSPILSRGSGSSLGPPDGSSSSSSASSSSNTSSTASSVDPTGRTAGSAGEGKHEALELNTEVGNESGSAGARGLSKDRGTDRRELSSRGNGGEGGDVNGPSRVAWFPDLLNGVLQLQTNGHLMSSETLDRIRDVDLSECGKEWEPVKATISEWLAISWRQKFKTLETSTNDLYHRIHKVRQLIDDHQSTPIQSVFRPLVLGSLQHVATLNYKLLEFTSVVNN